MEEKKTTETMRADQFIDHCGMEVIYGETCSARLHVEPMHLNPYGIVHGGVFYTMADTATGVTAMKYMESPVTLDSEFHFLGNVSSGTVTARSEIVKTGKHVMWLRAKVESEDGKLLAEGTFTYYSGKKKEAEK